MRLHNICKGVKIGFMKIKSFSVALFMFALAVAALAAAPTFTSVSPTQAQQGAIKSLAITGTNFDATTTMEISGTGVIVASVTAESATSLRANVIISTTAAVGARNIVLYNSGEAAVTAANAFTVTLSGTGPTILQMHFGKDQYKNPTIAAVYPNITVLPTFEVSFEVVSTLPATLSADSLNASVLTAIVTGDAYISSIADVRAYSISKNRPIVVSEITPVSSTHLHVFATLEAWDGLTYGQIIQVFVSAYDANAGSTLESYLAYIYSNADPIIRPPTTVEAVATDSVVVVPPYKIDPEQSKTIPLTIVIAQEKAVDYLRIRMFDSSGNVKGDTVYTYPTPQTNNLKVNYVIGQSINLSQGLHTFDVRDVKGNKIGRGKILVWYNR